MSAIEFEAGLFTEDSLGKFSAEASSLRLPAGQWPSKFMVQPNFGNGQVFLLSHAKGQDGEVAALVYKQEFGSVQITIFND